MADNTVSPVSDRQAIVLAMAAMLQKLENSREPVDPEQYRLLNSRLSDALKDIVMTADIERVLRQYPAAAEVYENHQYVHAGLCRAPLDQAVGAEQRMRALLAKVARA